MESVLKRHWGAGEESLGKLIVLAEKKPEIRRLKLKRHKDLADKVLHDGREVEEGAVVEFLHVLRRLVEAAPKA
jgi:ribosomal protein L30E